MIPIVIDVSYERLPLPLINSEFEKNIEIHDIFVIGDLHGNFKKLITTLVHLKFIEYRTADLANTNILQLLEKPQANITGILRILNHFFQPGSSKEKTLCFIGDTICDRGLSDFITLTIFNWLNKIGIDFYTILGNHEATILLSRPFSAESNLEFFWTNPTEKNSFTYFFNSFDYFRLLSEEAQTEFRYLLNEYFLHSIRLFSIIADSHSNDPILLTHAPITNELFDKIIKLYKFENKDKPHTNTRFTWSNLFNDPLLSRRIQYEFWQWFQSKLKLALNAPLISKIDKEFWDYISQFCSCRNDREPFFTTHDFPAPPQSQIQIPGLENELCGINPKYKSGTHVFGHMSGAYAGQLRPGYLTDTQMCLDTMTGMPEHPSGTVIYFAI